VSVAGSDSGDVGGKLYVRLRLMPRSKSSTVRLNAHAVIRLTAIDDRGVS